MALLHSLYIIVAINIHVDAQFEVTTISSPPLPYEDARQAVGFYNDTIYILGGGNNQRAFIQYIPSQNMFHAEANVMPYDCSLHSQSYTQMNDKLYWIELDTIYSYDYKSAVYNEEAIAARHPSDNACLASYNNLLFVLGGKKYQSLIPATMTDVQVFDTSTGSWIEAPNMITKRRDFACAVDVNRGTVYVIAGSLSIIAQWLKDIQTLVIGSDVTQATWTKTDNVLATTSWGYRAVYIENDDSILVIRDTIQRIDCSTKTASVVAQLNYDAANAATIYSAGVLYIFGGQQEPVDAWSVNTWQRVTNPVVFGITTTEAVTSLAPTPLPTALSTTPPTTESISSVAPTLFTNSLNTTDAFTTSESSWFTTLSTAVTNGFTTSAASTPLESSLLTTLSTVFTTQNSFTAFVSTHVSIFVSTQSVRNKDNDPLLAVLIIVVSVLFTCVLLVLGCIFYVDRSRKKQQEAENNVKLEQEAGDKYAVDKHSTVEAIKMEPTEVKISVNKANNMNPIHAMETHVVEVNEEGVLNDDDRMEGEMGIVRHENDDDDDDLLESVKKTVDGNDANDTNECEEDMDDDSDILEEVNKTIGGQDMDDINEFVIRDDSEDDVFGQTKT